ncbi:MAG: type IV secretion system DNA-binding domain-containing protein [Ktedonobacteraceae bacterium]|nr:type IV secretion system DNA-binding domain-containing protein [Ktedonobacteraceae bacterium]
MPEQAVQQAQIGSITIEVGARDAALIVYTTRELRGTTITLESTNGAKQQKPVLEWMTGREKVFAATFTTLQPGHYSMAWGKNSGQVLLEAGKITQTGIGIHFSLPVKTVSKYSPTDEDNLQESKSYIDLGTDRFTGQQITVDDVSRCSGCYIIGTQGVGKSSLLEGMIYQDIARNHAVIVLDPHGQLIDNIISRMEESHLWQVYLLDLTDEAYPFGFNIFACRDITDSRERTTTRNRVASIFDKIWPSENRGLLLPMLLQAVTETLIEHADSMTMADIPALLLDANYRAAKVATLRNKRLKEFWQLEYDTNSASVQRRETAPLRTRLNDWLSDQVITNIICQREATIDFREAIENQEIILIKLPVEQPGYEHAAPIIGTMILSQIYAATFSFQDVPEAARPGFSLYIDEFQYFATRDTARLFTGARKYKIRQTLAHQTRVQLRLPEVETATLTAHSVIAFKVVPADSREVSPLFSHIDLYPGLQHIPRLDLKDLRKHRNKAVSDFWAKYVRRWQEADNKEGRRRREDGEEWIEWPTWDLGFRVVSYRPHQVRAALSLVEDLFYHAMLTKDIDDDTLQSLQELIVNWYSPIEALEFIADLSEAVEALIKEPIGERKETNKAAIEDYLIHLEKRHALASIGQTTYQMKTLPLNPGVASYELDYRIATIQSQTRDRYCRSREEVEAELGSIESDEQEVTKQSDNVEELAVSNPSLALAKIRMDIEKLIKALYAQSAPQKAKKAPIGLSPMVQSLRKQGILDISLATTLQEIITIANAALHGETIEPEQATRAISLSHDAIEALTHLLKLGAEKSTWERFEPLD